MPTLNLNGIEVNFPYEPYACQIDYMKSVLESIKSRKNAILESPTGTGKTLCLLCSSISWLLAAKADLQLEAVKNELDEDDPAAKSLIFNSNLINKSNVKDDNVSAPAAAPPAGKIYPKIIYASRTHSQLTQVIRELKMTQYKNSVKTCAIGSRDQLCINPQVNQQKSYTAKLNMCKAKVTAKTCYFYNNVEYILPDLKNMLTVDIEDLVEFGNKKKCCPYYTARNLKDGADILFMPYNYLLDKKLRKSNNIEMQNTVVIFDEAHNVERVCEDSASADLSVTDIASAMSEISYLLEEMRSKLENQDTGYKPFNEDNDDFGLENPSASSSSDNMPATLDELKDVMMILKSFEDELDAVSIPTSGNNAAGVSDGVTKSASFLFEMLSKCHVTFERKGYVLDILNRLLQYFGAQVPSPRHHNGASLGKFYDFLQTVFSDNVLNESGSGDVKSKISKISQFYKVYIKSETVRGRTLYFWCLCPGYSMQDLLAEGARCIILTSGTLSPISTFKDEMKIQFEIVLENPHIIKETQIKVLSIGKGPDNVTLSSKYTNRDSEQYLRSLGQLVIDFASVVPHGVLVFFPSYKALDMTADFWRKNQQWRQIGEKKSIFIESKGAKECNETVSKFYERINDKKYSGAIMFAVCRGKISEGIDFADNNGRAVILTGLPFPLFTDPRVMLKRQYLDESKNSSGSLWYNQQTYRAINQAIGRVIRHKNDYGAIMLCDERFSQASSISQLPGWMRNHVKKITDFRSALSDLSGFFNVAIEKFPMPVPKIPNIQSNSRPGFFLPSDRQQQSNKKEDMNNLLSSYCCQGEPKCSATTSQQSNSDAVSFYDALDTYQPTNNIRHDVVKPTTSQSSQSEESTFKLVLQKRKAEQERNPKCRVVIKENVRIEEAKSEKLNDSKALLQKITSKLTSEEYQQFKVALRNFHEAKKSSDNEKKLKYYKVLRSLFSKDLAFFTEVENFIQFKGVIKPSQSTQYDSPTAPTKRKLDERN